MNGQPPPPLPPSAPSPPPPAPIPQRQVVIQSQGMGCFAKGCLTILIAGFILLAGIIGCSWYLLVKAVANFTSTAPTEIRIEAPTESQFQSAENSKNRLREAIANNKETTVEFTAADLNALLARDEDLADWNGRLRIEIADSIMTIAVSAPLQTNLLSKTKKRWFNGTARFSFSYENGAFDLDVRSAEAGGHEVPDILLSGGVITALNENLNTTFWDEMIKNDQSDFWLHVKTMRLVGDKLVITTQAE